MHQQTPSSRAARADAFGQTLALVAVVAGTILALLR